MKRGNEGGLKKKNPSPGVSWSAAPVTGAAAPRRVKRSPDVGASWSYPAGGPDLPHTASSWNESPFTGVDKPNTHVHRRVPLKTPRKTHQGSKGSIAHLFAFENFFELPLDPLDCDVSHVPPLCATAKLRLGLGVHTVVGGGGAAVLRESPLTPTFPALLLWFHSAGEWTVVHTQRNRSV